MYLCLMVDWVDCWVVGFLECWLAGRLLDDWIAGWLNSLMVKWLLLPFLGVSGDEQIYTIIVTFIFVWIDCWLGRRLGCLIVGIAGLLDDCFDTGLPHG